MGISTAKYRYVGKVHVIVTGYFAAEIPQARTPDSVCRSVLAALPAAARARLEELMATGTYE